MDKLSEQFTKNARRGSYSEHQTKFHEVSASKNDNLKLKIIDMKFLVLVGRNQLFCPEDAEGRIHIWRYMYWIQTEMGILHELILELSCKGQIALIGDANSHLDQAYSPTRS